MSNRNDKNEMTFGKAVKVSLLIAFSFFGAGDR
jgi:hypothetical protein